jgi:hypothetical protein
MQHFKAVFVGIVVVSVLALIGASGGENAPSETYPTAAEALPAAATVAEEPAIEPEEEPAELDTWLADEPDAEVADYGYEPAPYGRSDPSAVTRSFAGGDYDCGDFASHAEAQAFFEAEGGPWSDPHKLDRDGDGLACESL